MDGDESASLSAIDEFDLAGDLGVERVVAAATDVEARLVLGAALPHDDGAAGDDLAGESSSLQAAVHLNRGRF